MDINANQTFYEKLWKASTIMDPSQWGYWEITQQFSNQNILEIGPGNRPKVPIKGSHFIDISHESLDKLKQFGGITHQTNLQQKLPFNDGYFDLICCFEVLEHLPNDQAVLKEISRVLKNSGTALISFPINKEFWNAYDKAVGHYRRYEISEIEDLFTNAGLTINKASYSPVPWPNKFTGFILSILIKKIYFLTGTLQEIIDVLPGSHLTKKINFKSWKRIKTNQQKYSTIILRIKKAN